MLNHLHPVLPASAASSSHAFVRRCPVERCSVATFSPISLAHHLAPPVRYMFLFQLILVKYKLVNKLVLALYFEFRLANFTCLIFNLRSDRNQFFFRRNEPFLEATLGVFKGALSATSGGRPRKCGHCFLCTALPNRICIAAIIPPSLSPLELSDRSPGQL